MHVSSVVHSAQIPRVACLSVNVKHWNSREWILNKP